jgi:hypothetical protein
MAIFLGVQCPTENSEAIFIRFGLQYGVCCRTLLTAKRNCSTGITVLYVALRLLTRWITMKITASTSRM